MVLCDSPPLLGTGNSIEFALAAIRPWISRGNRRALGESCSTQRAFVHQQSCRALLRSSGRRQEGTPSVNATVFVGTSVDGFIARSDGTYNFLPPGGGEPHGYDEFMATVDAMVIGRKTYESVLALDKWPYGAKPVFVLSRHSIAPAPVGAVVERVLPPPAHIVSRLSTRGIKHIYVDGGITVQGFLRAGLVRRLIITRVPVLIGTGIPLFGATAGDIVLKHIATRQYASGLVQSEYEIAT